MAGGWLDVWSRSQGQYGLLVLDSVVALALLSVLVGVLWVLRGRQVRSRNELLRSLRSELADRERAEAALRESEVFYHSLVESLPQSILRKDLEGRFTFANSRFLNALGQPLEAIVGKTDFDLFPRELAEKYRRDDLQVIHSGQTLDIIEKFVTPHGETMYVQVIKTPLLAADGRCIGIQGIFWDVTARHRAEERLQEQNQRLQEMARSEREAHDTLKVAQGRMAQSEKLISLGQMITGVAHEINNPLSFVTNNVAVLERDLGDVRTLMEQYRQLEETAAERRPELVEAIRRLREEIDLDYLLENLPGLLNRTRDGLRRIHQIVTDLRGFARVDDRELNEVDLVPGIEATINIILGYAKKRNVRLVRDLGPLPPVLCLGAKIDQVVMNLISNAIDACPEGGEVTIRTYAADDEARIEVSDTGMGIDPAIREKIFDPFFTTKPAGQGTGLGLAISAQIVQDHGGSIAVESAPGRGSRFCVHLPIRPPGAPSAPSESIEEVRSR